MDQQMNPNNENIDLFKAQKQTKWKARLADWHLSSMHFDNPDADKDHLQLSKTTTYSSHGYGLSERPAWPAHLTVRNEAKFRHDQ